MAFIQADLAGHLILGAALVALGATVALRSQDPDARRLLPAFLVLSGLRLGVEGAGHLVRILGHDHRLAQAWSQVPGILAAPLLAAYAMRAATGRRLHWPMLLLSAPLAVAYVAHLPATPEWLTAWRLAQETAWSALAVGAAFLAYARAPGGVARERAEAFLVPTVLLAFPLVTELVVYAPALLLAPFPSYSGLVAQSVLLGVLLALLAAAMAVARAGRHAVRPLLACGAFLSAVAAVWLLYASGVLADSPGGPIWSVRWFVSLLALAVGISAYGLWELRGRAARHVGRAAVPLMLAMAANQVAGILLVLPGITPAMAVGAAVALAALLASITYAVRWAGWSGPAGSDWERLAHLRAATMVSPERAEGVRRDLRLPPRSLRPAEPRADAEAPHVGRLFKGRYEVRALAGAGAQGEVYEAWDRRRGVAVVLKRFRDPPGAAREARAALGLRHPHLAGLLDVEPAADGWVLVLEHVDGQTLWQHLARKGPDGRVAAVVARDIGRALRFLHDAGYAHGDVKPDNIMLRRDGRAVLIDCGASRAGHDPGERARDWSALQAVLAGCRHPARPEPTLASPAPPPGG